MLIQVSPKLASDSRSTSCDFAPLLVAGLSITSATVSVSLYSGTDTSPPTFTTSLSGGSVVYVNETAGVAGNIYLVKVLGVATTPVPAITYLLAVLPDQP
ncbi:hypothetical protein UFOVP2_27 [uncultured Caudovirales phage]|uniref:Uncharacterized protein n=1 Tax=uncultured Caudovirales phage TaxID=2100421 RepID=A0A6J5KKW3_9CAUD|nr:hypothetical protein UFOVP2_27 [uncultured Caudovirales phage]